MDFFLLAECTWRLRTSGKTKGHLIQTEKEKQTLSVLTSPKVLVPLPDAGAHCGWGLSCLSPEPHSLYPPGPSPPLPILPGESRVGLPSSRLLPRLVPRLRCWVSVPCPCLLRAIFPFRSHITSPPARPEYWQPAPSPEATPLFWPPPIPAGSLCHPH